MALASERLVQLYPFLKKIHAMLQELITEDQRNQFRKNTGMPRQENVKSSLLMILSVSPPPSLSILEPGDVPAGKYQSHYKRDFQKGLKLPGTGTRKEVEELSSWGKSRDLPE